MNYKKLFGFGVLIWAVAYLVATAFVAYKMGESLLAQIVITLAVIAASCFCGWALELNSVKEILKYSASWLVIAFVLDLILTVPFTGWRIFYSWELWAGYLAILLVPLLSAKKTPVPTV